MTNISTLARQWRPLALEDVVGQTLTVAALRNALNHKHLHHAYLFTGTRGVGKTSLARILARAMNCEKGISSTPCLTCNSCTSITAGQATDVIEIDAASKTKVEDTRELLEQTQFHPIHGQYKIFIIDEVHMLSGHSFNALLKTLEEPPQHVKFLLATTDLDKVPQTVRSRCIHFPLSSISEQDILDHLSQKLTEINVAFEPGAISLLAKHGRGSLRDTLSLLEQALMVDAKNLRQDSVNQLLGLIPSDNLEHLLQILYSGEQEALLELMDNMRKKSQNPDKLLTQLLERIHLETRQNLISKSKTYQDEFLQIAYDVVLTGLKNSAPSGNAQMNLEMTLMRVAFFQPAKANVTVQTNNQHQNVTPPSTAASLTTDQFIEMAKSFKLSGMSLALIKEISFDRLENDKIYFFIKPSIKSLVTDNTQREVLTALKNQGVNCRSIHIEPKDNPGPTLSMQNQQNSDAHKTAMKSALKTHPIISPLLEKLQADIEKINIQEPS